MPRTIIQIADWLNIVIRHDPLLSGNFLRDELRHARVIFLLVEIKIQIPPLTSQRKRTDVAQWPLICYPGSMPKITEAKRDHIADESFAFPKERKEPIHDAAHVRNAIARFKQVQGVTDSERDAAWKRIKSAAKKHKVELKERSWRELS
jgi:hypothetical protein